MRELIKNVIFHKKELIFISKYITLTFCCTKFEVHYLCGATKLISGDTAPFVALLYTFEPYYEYTKNFLFYYMLLWKLLIVCIN